MDQEKDYLRDLTEIRSMMEKSSRFISLSGLSGVFAGIFALIGAALAYMVIQDFFPNILSMGYEAAENKLITLLFLDAGLVLLFALLTGYFFTSRKAKRQGLTTWNKASRQMLWNIALPLMSGGVFCAALAYHGVYALVAPSMLVFYGIALINGSKYTLDDIRYLGYLEIVLGLAASFAIGYGLWFWAFGFGVLHIVYGTAMYFKYEHQNRLKNH